MLIQSRVQHHMKQLCFIFLKYTFFLNEQLLIHSMNRSIEFQLQLYVTTEDTNDLQITQN